MKILKIILIILLLILLLILFRNNITNITNNKTKFGNVLYRNPDTPSGTLQIPGITSGEAANTYGPGILFNYTNPSSTGDTNTNNYSVFNNPLFNGFTSGGTAFINPNMVLFDLGANLNGLTVGDLNSNETYTNLTVGQVFGNDTVNGNTSLIHLFKLYYSLSYYIITPSDPLLQITAIGSPYLGSYLIYDQTKRKYNLLYFPGFNTNSTSLSFTPDIFYPKGSLINDTLYYKLKQGSTADTFNIGSQTFNTLMYKKPLIINNYYAFGISLVNTLIDNYFQTSLGNVAYYKYGKFKYVILKLTVDRFLYLNDVGQPTNNYAIFGQMNI